MKDIIITAGGKNITPSELENDLKFSPYITDAVVVGDKRPYLVVIIMIDQENVEKFAQDNDIPFSNYASLTLAKEVQDLIRDEIERVNKKFARVEQIKKFFLLQTQLSAEDEELTPTMKLKRKLVEKKYAEADRRHVPLNPRHPTLGTPMMKRTLSTLFAATLALAAGASLAQSQGVSKNEILVGSILDMSGPLAAYGKATRQGMLLRAEEANEQGGIHGRKIKLVVEDDGYDPKRAVLAAQKLVNQDKVFVVAGHIGTAQNNAAMPVQFEKNVINFLPITAAREMYEPFNRLKYSFAVTYYDQMRTFLPKLVKDKGAKKVCAIYQDDDFGLEVLRGAEAGLKTMNMELTEKSSFKRGSTDFSSQVARAKAAGCEMVVLGTIIRETIGTIGEARKSGLQPGLRGHVRRLHRTDPQAGRQGDGRPVRDDDRADPVPGRPVAGDPLLGQQVQDQVQRRPDAVLGLRLHGDGLLHPGGGEGRPQSQHRQLHQVDGLDELPDRHVRGAAVHLRPDEAAGQRCVAPVADHRWQVEGDFRLRQALKPCTRCRFPIVDPTQGS